MSSWRQQTLIEAPVEVVWSLVGDPNRYSEWAATTVEVTGLPTVERDATFRHVSPGLAGRRAETTFRIEQLDDLREIKLRCLATGFYSHWLLTEARGATFVDVRIGMEPTAPQYRVFDATAGKFYFRRLGQRSLDTLRDAAAREASRGSN